MIDFLIIGGGIAGCSVASHLAPLGSVVLLEAEDALAHHASGRSAAAFEKNYGLASTIALTEASEDGHIAFDVLTPRGLLLLAKEHERTEFQTDTKTLGLEEITVAEALDMVPIIDQGVVTSAAHHTAMWDIDTDRLLQTFVSRAKVNGAQVMTRSKVEDIQKHRNGWRVLVGGTWYETKHLINAAGPWADKIAKMAGVAPIGLQPYRRSMGRIPAPGGHDVAGWPMIFGPGESWYAKPDAGAVIVSPAEEDPKEPHDAYADDMILAEGFARYESYVTEPVTRLITSWAGLRTFAPDRQLVLGPEPIDPSFVWCAGQGGYGMQSCHGAAQLIAELVSGRSTSLPTDTVDALSPNRFR